MKQIKNFVSREQIREDLQEIEDKKHAESPAHLEFMSQKYWDSKEYEICCDYLTRAIELNPNQYAYFKRSQCFYHLKEWDNAISDLDTALSIQPDYENALMLKQLIQDKIAENRKYSMKIYG